MTLDQIQPGNDCRIIDLFSRDKLCKRLLSMGFFPGLELRVVRNAPLNDPMEIKIGTSFLSLRRHEARYIEVEPA